MLFYLWVKLQNYNMWKLRNYNKELESELAKKHPRLIARLLSQRNIPSTESEEFIKASYESIPHPFKLEGMEKALQVFKNAALKKAKLITYADFDADGIISAAMLQELASLLKLEFKAFLPSRLKTGYGLNSKGVEAFKEFLKATDYKPDLLLVVDCGSNSEEEVKELKKIIPFVIVIDHHTIEKDKQVKSADAFVNWHLNNHDEMCAAGEIFQFIRAIRTITSKINPIQFLSLAAIATIGDASPIKGINRIIVKNGLTKYALDHVIGGGLAALLEHSKISPDNLNQVDVGYRIVPFINAAGRVSDPDLAYRLIIEQNQIRATKMVETLAKHSENRKKIQKHIEIEAKIEIEANPDKFQNGILLYKPDWNIGVVGIVAAKLSETYNLPVIVAGLINKEIKGSARCNNEVDIKEVLDSCSQIFESYGGHSAAAGVTLKESMIDKANSIFNEACKVNKAKHKREKQESQYDAELKISSVSLDTAKVILENLYPYSSDFNPEPIFKLSNITVKDCNLFEPKGWKILTFKGVKDGEKCPFAFKMFTNDFGTELEGANIDIYFRFPQSCKKDSYNKYELNVIDIVKRG
jgi:single-stranded-DNA-specific exonuclease